MTAAPNNDFAGNVRGNNRVEFGRGGSVGKPGGKQIGDAETSLPSSRSVPEPTRPPRLVGRVQLDAIRPALSDRDISVLRTLEEFRLATTDQLRRMLFTGHTSVSAASWACRKSLRKLRDFGLIDHLEHHIGGVRAGSSGKVWRLRPAAHRLLNATNRNGKTPRTVRREPSVHIREHTLATTEVAAQLHEQAHTGKLEVIECTPEPACWRTYINTGGGLVRLKPDLFAVTATPGSTYEDLWFIEVDRATESLPTIRRKATAYDTYRATGKEQTNQGTFPKVVWLTPDNKRAEQITNTLNTKAHGRQLTTTHLAMPLDAFARYASGTTVGDANR